MPARKRTAHATGEHRPQPGTAERKERKQRVLTQGTPSITRSIADAIVVKNEGVFFLAQPDGNVPLEHGHGFGLYYHDCRYLNGYALEIAGVAVNPLVATAARGFKGTFELTNPDIRTKEDRLIPKEHLGLRWERTVDGDMLALHDRISFYNFGLERVELPVSLRFRAEFEDVYIVRGLLGEIPGNRLPSQWEGDVLGFAYEGADGVYRGLTVHFDPAPVERDGTSADFLLAVEPRQATELRVSLFLAESKDRSVIQPRTRTASKPERVDAALGESSNEWVRQHTAVDSDSLLLNSIVDRSFRDLRVLRSRVDDQVYFAAGVPWFVALFGRDSIITALQTLAYDPRIAEHTLRLLARYQGTRVDEWKDEQPGKILHELRVGELARMGSIPYTPYYGTVDATPLFLILVARHATWTGDLALFHELREPIEAALEWMDRHGALEGEGYIRYESASTQGLINQGWKDSGDAIVNAQGELAEPPIALVEVQAYAFEAKRLMAGLYRRAGAEARADRLGREAEALRARFERDFWLEDRGIYALALQQGGDPAAVVSSNPGHALWAGIADAQRARRTMERLLADDMFSGWGVRTLSSEEVRYNPIGYHLGTVWPHDNAILAAGFRRYGFDEEALRIFRGIVGAAMHFDAHRLPELFAGFGREDFGVPVHYPVANHPQAWGAGSVPYMLECLLGLNPEAFERRLRIVRPILPEFVDRLELRGLRVGAARVDLRFARGDGGVAVQVVGSEGDVDVVVEENTRNG